MYKQLTGEPLESELPENPDEDETVPLLTDLQKKQFEEIMGRIMHWGKRIPPTKVEDSQIRMYTGLFEVMSSGSKGVLTQLDFVHAFMLWLDDKSYSKRIESMKLWID